jgi:hypothetical protein
VDGVSGRVEPNLNELAVSPRAERLREAARSLQRTEAGDGVAHPGFEEADDELTVVVKSGEALGNERDLTRELSGKLEGVSWHRLRVAAIELVDELLGRSCGGVAQPGGHCTLGGFDRPLRSSRLGCQGVTPGAVGVALCGCRFGTFGVCGLDRECIKERVEEAAEHTRVAIGASLNFR